MSKYPTAAAPARPVRASLMPDDPIEPLLLVPDLARILGRSPKAIYNLRMRGGLPLALRIGGVLGWRPRDIREWLESRRG